MEANTSTSTSSIRTAKRKLEDAIRTLDGAIESSSPASHGVIETPTPSKRPRLARSVYSALTKFGPSSKERVQPSSDNSPPIDISRCAPRLAAIIARSARHHNQPSLFTPPSTRLAYCASEYRPSSTDSFLSRLATYKITTFANKPSQIDAVAAAKCGWINDGKDRLVCGICDVSWVLASREGMNKDAASALVEKQRISLVEMHKNGCPWRARQCESSVYQIHLQAPGAMVRGLRATAFSLQHILVDVVVKHPLTLSQMSSLHAIFSAAAREEGVLEHNHVMDVDEVTHPALPTDMAIVVALFGWVPASTATHSELRRASSSFMSPTWTHGPSASTPPTPSLSRAGSFSSHFQEQSNSPAPSASPRMSISHLHKSSARGGLSSKFSENTAYAARDVPLMYCVLCLRRVGFWGSRNGKEFDLVKEHRSYCPYVVTYSLVPSFSHSPTEDLLGNLTEGWRAVLAVVQRYELGQRQRLSRFLPSNDPNNQLFSAELKSVESMVAGVKTNGGKELLKYIKGVLG